MRLSRQSVVSDLTSLYSNDAADNARCLQDKLYLAFDSKYDSIVASCCGKFSPTLGCEEI